MAFYENDKIESQVIYSNFLNNIIASAYSSGVWKYNFANSSNMLVNLCEMALASDLRPVLNVILKTGDMEGNLRRRGVGMRR